MKTIEDLTEKNTKLKRILSHIFPDKSGKYFICGELGKHENDLPEMIVVCPMYGSDAVQIYRKDGNTTSPEY
jgi:hypothetical protein